MGGAAATSWPTLDSGGLAASGLAAVVGSLAGGVLGQALGVRQTLFLAIGGLLLGPLVSVFTPLWRVGEMPQGAVE